MWACEGVLLTRTSLSPILGIDAFSSSFSASKPVLPATFHCLVVDGAMMCDVGGCNSILGYKIAIE